MKMKILSIMALLAVPALAQQQPTAQQAPHSADELWSTNWSLAGESLVEESLQQMEGYGMNVHLLLVHGCPDFTNISTPNCGQTQLIVIEMNEILEEYLTDAGGFKESTEQLKRDVALADTTQAVRLLELAEIERRNALIAELNVHIHRSEEKMEALRSFGVHYTYNPWGPFFIRDHHWAHLRESFYSMEENIDRMRIYRQFLMMTPDLTFANQVL